LPLTTTSGITPTTAGTSIITTQGISTTTTSLPPTTTTMNYCTNQQGMNQPLNITPTDYTTNPSPQQTTPPGDINPTSTTPGLNFPTSLTPQINVTVNQPANLTVIYIPVDRPKQPPSNVDQFSVIFVFPNNTVSQEYPSSIPSITSTSTTTTTSTSSSSLFTTPITTTTTVIPPSNLSPIVNLPTNFQIPSGTTIIITITLTTNQTYPTGVCIVLKYFLKIFLSN
jgi:hypothetical protein